MALCASVLCLNLISPVRAQQEEVPLTPDVANEPLLRGDLPISMEELDLSDVPTEAALRAAGGMGGALIPIDNADVDKLPEKLEKQGKDPQTVAKQLDRLKKINKHPGKSLKALKKHHFNETIALYQEHLELYPDSPWAGEIYLHLGKWAAANGRYSEAEARFGEVLRVTQDNPQHFTYDLAQKTKVAWASLDVTLGKWNSAAAKLDDILATERNYRRLSWARYFRHEVEMSAQSTELAACGAHALAVVLQKSGKSEAARKIAVMPAPREAGFSMDELQKLGEANGVALRGFRGTVADLPNLPTPLLVHYDFGAGRAPGAIPSAFAVAMQDQIVGPRHCPDCPQPADAPQNFTLQRPHHAISGPFGNGAEAASAGHFLIVERINAKTRRVAIFNPLEKRTYFLTFEQFGREWSGNGLMLEKSRVARPNAAASTLIYLSRADMGRIHGGCCCADGRESNLGVTPFGIGVDSPSNCAKGAPAIDVNPVSLNVHLQDAPLWYDSPLGYEVQVQMHFNSGEAQRRFNLFGAKWSCLYDTALLRTSANMVSILMPDGRQRTFSWNGNEFLSETGFFSRLVANAADESYTLFLAEGGRWVFAKPPGYAEYRLMRSEDVHGNALVLNWTTSPTARLASVQEWASGASNAIRTISFEYGNLKFPANPTRIIDPYGRSASFVYEDASAVGDNGLSVARLRYVTDMHGLIVSYTYQSSFDDIAQIKVDGRNWTFSYVNNTGNYNGYPYFKDLRPLQIADPYGRREEFYYDASHSGSGQTYHVDKQNFTASNTPAARPRTVYGFVRAADGTDKVAFITPPADENFGGAQDGAVTAFGYDGFAMVSDVSAGYNAARRVTISRESTGGQVWSVRTPNPESGAINSAIRNVEYRMFVNPARGAAVADPYRFYDATTHGGNGNLIAQIEWNDRHQPTAIYLAPTAFSGNTPTQFASKTAYTYAPWGAMLSQVVSQSNGAVTQSTFHNYDGEGRETATTANAPLNAGGQWLALFYYDPVVRTRVTGVLNGYRHRINYDYDNFERVNKVTYGDGTTESATYCNSCGVKTSTTDRAGRTTTYVPDALRRITSARDSAGSGTKMTYDAVGRLVKMTDSAGRETLWLRNNRGQVKEKRFFNGDTELFFYNAFGDLERHLLTDITNQESRRATVDYQYQQNGALSALTFVDKVYAGDTDGKVYASNADVTGPNYPGSVRRFLYDLNGRARAISEEVGEQRTTLTTQLEFDVLGRVRRENGPFNDDTLEYDYNANGDRAAVRVRADGGLVRDGYNTAFSYDSLARLTQIQGFTGTFGYEYAENAVHTAALPTSMTWPSNGGVDRGGARFEWDLYGRQARSRWQGTTGAPYNAEFVSTFDPVVQINGVPRARDVKVSFERRFRNTANQIAPWEAMDYGYESNASMTGLDQLTNEVSREATPVVANSWNYNPVGNRTLFERPSSTPGERLRTNYNGNSANQVVNTETRTLSSNGTLLDVSRSYFEYDSRGNTIGASPINTPAYGGIPEERSPYFITYYGYDALNRLRRIERRTPSATPNDANPLNRLPRKSHRTDFFYDSAGRRRIVREYDFAITSAGDGQNAETMRGEWRKTDEQRFVYDGMQVVQERDESNATQAQLTWGVGMAGGAGALLCRAVKVPDPKYTYYRLYNVVSDHNGNVCQLVRQDTSAVVAIYRYDAYGLHTTEARADSDTLDAAQVSQPWRYQSKWHHGQSGLVDFGYRYYAPGLGNWMSRDPLGEAGGLNLYGYVGNDPVNMMDADGLVSNHVSPMVIAGNQQYMQSFFEGTVESAGQGVRAGLDGANPFGDPYADAGAYNRNDGWVGWSQGAGAVGSASLTVAGGLATGGFGLALGTSGTEAAIVGSLPAQTGVRVLLTHPAAGAAFQGALASGVSSALDGDNPGQVFNNTVQGGAISGAFKAPGNGIPGWATGTGQGIARHYRKGSQDKKQGGGDCDGR